MSDSTNIDNVRYSFEAEQYFQRQLEEALKSASGEALGQELEFIVDPKTNKLNPILLGYFDGNTLTAVRMMIARKQYDHQFREAKALTSKTSEEMFDPALVSETATNTLNLAAAAVNKDLTDELEQCKSEVDNLMKVSIVSNLNKQIVKSTFEKLKIF